MIVGRGRCAELRALSDDNVLKLYEARFSHERVEGFAAVGKQVHAVGIRTPAITTVLTEGDRSGLVMERVHGTTLWDAIRAAEEPTKFGRLLAELHAEIHAYLIDGLASKLEEIADRIERRAEHSPDAVAQARAIVTSGRRDSPVLVHGDLHPANVMVDEAGELISIDWDGAQHGPAALDVARAYFLIAEWAVAPGTDPIDPAVRHLVANAYVERYIEIAHMAIEEIEAWYLPLVLARYSENVAAEVPMLDAFVLGKDVIT